MFEKIATLRAQWRYAFVALGFLGALASVSVTNAVDAVPPDGGYEISVSGQFPEKTRTPTSASEKGEGLPKDGKFVEFTALSHSDQELFKKGLGNLYRVLGIVSTDPKYPAMVANNGANICFYVKHPDSNQTGWFYFKDSDKTVVVSELPLKSHLECGENGKANVVDENGRKIGIAGVPKFNGGIDFDFAGMDREERLEIVEWFINRLPIADNTHVNLGIDKVEWLRRILNGQYKRIAEFKKDIRAASELVGIDELDAVGKGPVKIEDVLSALFRVANITIVNDSLSSSPNVSEAPSGVILGLEDPIKIGLKRFESEESAGIMVIKESLNSPVGDKLDGECGEIIIRLERTVHALTYSIGKMLGYHGVLDNMLAVAKGDVAPPISC